MTFQFPISSRFGAEPADPVGDLFSVLSRGDIISFAGGIPDGALFAYDDVRASFEHVLAHNARRALQYGSTPGEPELREAARNVKDGGTIIGILEQQNIPHKMSDNGAVMVPGNRVHEVRLKLASQGLPRGGKGREQGGPHPQGRHRPAGRLGARLQLFAGHEGLRQDQSGLDG